MTIGRRVVVALVHALTLSGAGSAAGADPLHFRIEPEASELTFAATSRLMNADGKFHRFAGEVVADPNNLATARVSLSVDATSIDTGISLRDRHLRSDDFFDVERFPTITFESLRVEADGRRVTVVGRLTMHGTSREIAVPLTVEITDTALVARGEFTVNRSDYSIKYKSFLNPIGEVVRVAFVFLARAARP